MLSGCPAFPALCNTLEAVLFLVYVSYTIVKNHTRSGMLKAVDKDIKIDSFNT